RVRAERTGNEPWPPLCHHRAGLCHDVAGLRARPRCRVAPPVRDVVRVPGNGSPHGLPLRPHPKGFFPQQDTGLITGISEAGQDVSFAEMMRRQEALGDVIGKDPAVATYAMALGASGSTSTLNNGRFYITLKPKSERDVSAGQVIARLRPQLAKVEGARLFLQASQDVNVGGRLARTQFQYTLQDANIDEL